MKRVFVDQLGREVKLNDYPRRIISLVPSQTELLHYFGLEEEVVGITKFCIHPKEWFETKKRVGGTKQLKLELIRSLQPDLIIGNKEENTKADIEALEKEFPVWLSDINSIEDSLSMILAIGEMTGKQQEANNLVKEIKDSFSTVSSLGQGKKVLYFIWHEPAFVVGRNTFIDAMLSQLGFENACTKSRYPSLDELTALQPDYIFLSSEPFPFSEQHLEYYRDLFPHSKLLLVDGEMFSWYGSRMKLAVDYFRSLRIN